MPALSYGLNVPTRRDQVGTRPPTGSRKALFDDDSEPEDENVEGGVEEIQTFGAVGSPAKSTASKPSQTPQKPRQHDSRLGAPGSSEYNNLSAAYSSKKHADLAQELDSNINEYDAVYDSLHAQPKKKQTTSKGPKYMQGLLESAEIRKRDQLQAKDKLLAREREEEGEQYADKEKFVTGAYKAQQEEVRRQAEEEKKREEEAAERRRKAGGGMTGLYKGLLDREEERHAAIAQALHEGPEVTNENAEDEAKEQLEAAKKSGATLNEDGQVVDKRQLLKAGLNVKPKSKAPENDGTRKEETRTNINPAAMYGNNAAKTAMRERQTRMLESQLEEAAKRAADDELVEQETLQKAAKSKKTKEDISSARERFLQRKKEAEAAKAKEKNS